MDKSDPHAVHEAGRLNLSIVKARRILGWKPRWGFAETVKQTMGWYGAVARGMDPKLATQEQIAAYCT